MNENPPPSGPPPSGPPPDNSYYINQPYQLPPQQPIPGYPQPTPGYQIPPQLTPVPPNYQAPAGGYPQYQYQYAYATPTQPQYAPAPPQPYSDYGDVSKPPSESTHIAVTINHGGGDRMGYEPMVQWYSSTQQNMFIAKVMGVLMSQLLFTVAICVIFEFTVPDTFRLPWWGALLLIIGLFVLLFALKAVQNKFPWNYLLLFVFTAAIASVVGLTIISYSLTAVLNALAVTILIPGGIIIYVIVTKEDFRLCASLIVTMTLWTMFWWAMFTFLFYPLIYGDMSMYGVFFDLLGIMLFTGLLLYDISSVVNRHHGLGQDDEVIQGAISLYLDIVNLFLCLLSLFGGRK